RLDDKRRERNMIRHEWVSLRLFLAFVGDDDDAGWLTRLADESRADTATWITPGRYLRDGQDFGIDAHAFRGLTGRAPLAAAIGWLVLSHHRLPVITVHDDEGQQVWVGKKANRFDK